jgi:hypothetical protein
MNQHIPLATPTLPVDRRGQDNPNLPHDVIGLRAFNLVPGAAFMLIDQPDPRVWIAEKVSRDAATERVSVWAHDGTNADIEDQHLAFEQAFNLDYCTLVGLVGIVVNPDDPEDNDWGSND